MQIDVTWNLLFTPLFIFILGIVIRQWNKKSDTNHKLEFDNIAQKMETVRLLATERHENLCAKVNGHNEDNKKEHDDIWSKINHHNHTQTNGKVVDTR